MKYETQIHSDRACHRRTGPFGQPNHQKLQNYELDSEHLPGTAKRDAAATPIDSQARSTVSSGTGVLHLPTGLAGAVR